MPGRTFSIVGTHCSLNLILKDPVFRISSLAKEPMRSRKTSGLCGIPTGECEP